MCAGVKTSIVYGHQTLQVGVYYIPIFYGLDHQTFQVTKMEVLTTHHYKLYVRSVSRKPTRKIAGYKVQDSSILGTWNSWWLENRPQQ